nr:hypothetical protein [uncultured Rhodopila sp.]
MWLSRHHGRRLSRGDLIFVQASQPAPVGDAAVILRGNKLVGIGDLIETNADYVLVQTGDQKQERIGILNGENVLKIVLVQYG